jgi:hypothetical protein
MPRKNPALIRTRKERFVLEYLKDLKGEKAAIRAGFPPAGARTQASRMLRDVEVRERLAMHEAKLAAKYDLAHDKVIRDIIDLGERAELGGQFATALRAKELAGRHVGMWPNKAEVTGPNGGPIPVMAATVVLPIEAMNPEQREALRSALLLAKAKERAMNQAAEEGEEEE